MLSFDVFETNQQLCCLKSSSFETYRIDSINFLAYFISRSYKKEFIRECHLYISLRQIFSTDGVKLIRILLVDISKPIEYLSSAIVS